MFKFLTGAACVLVGVLSLILEQPEKMAPGDLFGFILKMMGPDSDLTLVVTSGCWLSLVFGSACFLVYKFCMDKNPQAKDLIYLVLVASCYGSIFTWQFRQGLASGFFELFFVFPFALMLGQVILFGSGSLKSKLGKAFQLPFTDIWKFVGMYIMIYLVGAFIYLISSGAFVYMLLSFFTDQLPVDAQLLQLVTVLLMVFISSVLLGSVIFLLVYATALLYFSLQELDSADQLKARILKIGVRKK
jgi:hypothetical protein